jgi:hypothetical protein
MVFSCMTESRELERLPDSLSVLPECDVAEHRYGPLIASAFSLNVMQRSAVAARRFQFVQKRFRYGTT